MASNHIRNIGPMQAAPKCERIRMNGQRCRGMAVRGRRLCRSHGGKAGAPKGNQNALKDGLYTKTSRARDRAARELVKQAKALLGAITAASGRKTGEIEQNTEKHSKNRILVEDPGELWRQHEGGGQIVLLPHLLSDKERGIMSSDSTPFVAPNADTSLEAIRDRAIGALLGLAVGDAVGTTLEFRPRDSYEPLTDMVGGGPFGLRAGEWTDDTSQALALADSLVAYPQLNEQDLMERFVAWHEKGDYSCTGRCFDIGITTRNALDRFKRTGNPIAGSTDPMSAGNGSLMRLAPVAIRFWNDRDALIDVAAHQSRVTHGASEAVDACVAFAEMMADAIAGRPVEEFVRGGDGPYAGAIGYIVGGSWRGRQRYDLGSSGYVAHSFETAIWCLATQGPFENAVLFAANLGEDADTTAAITGQLQGAYRGASAIPAHWLAQLAWRERIAASAAALFDASIG